MLCLPPKNRARRARTYFDDRAIQILEHAFLQEQYPDIHRREQLSNEIGTTEARVQVRKRKTSLLFSSIRLCFVSRYGFKINDHVVVNDRQ